MSRGLALFVFSILIISCCYPQQLNGLMEADLPSESAKINIDPDLSLLLVSSDIPSLRFDSNRKIDKVNKVSSGNWEVWLPAGTHILKIDAEGYERLELSPFPFLRKKAYQLRIKEIRPPRLPNSLVGKGKLQLSTEPQRVRFSIQGLPGSFTTPWEDSILTNKWRITFFKENYDTLVAEVTVYKDSTTSPLPFRLIPRFGFIRINGQNISNVLLDGDILTDYQVGLPREVSLGVHQLILKKPKHNDYSTSVSVAPGQIVEIEGSFVPQFGIIQFEDIRGTLTIDDRIVNILEPQEVDLGQHKLTLLKTKGPNRTKLISIKPGETITVTGLDFEEPGKLTITADVMAEIYVNNKMVGKGNVTSQFPSGDYEVKVVHPELGSKTQQVSLQPLEEKKLSISLRPSRSTAMWLTLIPGTSQIYKSQSTRGYLYLGFFIAGVGTSSYLWIRYNAQNDDYKKAVDLYNQAISPVETVRLKNDAISEYNTANDTGKLRNIALISAGAIFLWNVLDVFLFPPEFGYRNESISSEISITPFHDELSSGLTMHIGF